MIENFVRMELENGKQFDDIFKRTGITEKFFYAVKKKIPEKFFLKKKKGFRYQKISRANVISTLQARNSNENSGIETQSEKFFPCL